MLADIELTTRVNGEIRQQDRTSRMIFDFLYIINYVSTFISLEPGDILVCGVTQPVPVPGLIRQNGCVPVMC